MPRRSSPGGRRVAPRSTTNATTPNRPRCTVWCSSMRATSSPAQRPSPGLNCRASSRTSSTPSSSTGSWPMASWGCAAATAATTVQARPHRISRARRLERVFDIDMQHCPNCGTGELKIIAAGLTRARRVGPVTPRAGPPPTGCAGRRSPTPARLRRRSRCRQAEAPAPAGCASNGSTACGSPSRRLW